jgi:uncharacterized protein (TIGR03435 family)
VKLLADVAERAWRALRVKPIGMSMPGAALKSRLQQILDGRRLLPISRARVTTTVALCAISSAMFVAGTLARQAQPAPAFEVVSIKPCAAERALPGVAPPPPPGARRGGAFGYHAQTTPGHVYWDCATLVTLVDQAYADADHPLLNTYGNSIPPQPYGPVRPKRVRGGPSLPSWVENDKFAVEVKSPLELTTPALAGSTGRNLVTLPVGMSLALRAALEDRFQLKVRRVTEERDMFALVLAKGGLNPEKVKAPVPGDCMTADEYFATAGQRPPGPNNILICGRIHSRIEGMAYASYPISKLASDLSSMMDQFVVDRTGSVPGVFNFFLTIEPRQSPEGGTEEARLRKGLADLGFKLEPIKGPAEFLMIDSVQKPRPNVPAPIGAQR